MDGNNLLPATPSANPNPPFFAELMMPIMSAEEAKKRYDAFKAFIKEHMKGPSDTEPLGIDYGPVGGVSKPTLKKPGAEKLRTLFGLEPRLELIDKIENWGKGHFESGKWIMDEEPLFFYRYRVTLARGGYVMGVAEGACTSREAKYRWRKADRICTECGAPTIIRSRYPPRDFPEDEPGWYCNLNRGGCGANYDFADVRISGQTIERYLNPDVADLVNTFVKIAQKRAFIGSVLMAVNASEFFTQDLEDFEPDDPPPPRQRQTNGAANGATNGATNGAQQGGGAPKISEAQAGRFYGKAKGSGKSDQEINDYLRSRGFDRSGDITKDVYDAMCTWADARPTGFGQETQQTQQQQPRGNGPQRRSQQGQGSY